MQSVKDLWNEYSNVNIKTDLNVSALIGTFIGINMSYYVLNWYFSKSKRFSQLYNALAYHRKRYVVKNILKAIYLAILSCVTSYFICLAFFYDKWVNNELHLLGLLYAMIDLISLFRVPGLSRNTIQHHITVVILGVMNLTIDYTKDTYWRGIMIYCYLSMVTFMVNFYLGYRLIDSNSKRKLTVTRIAFWNYLISIAMNWSYQLYIIGKWLPGNYHLYGLYVNLLLIYFVVQDDIILISFLYYNAYKKSPSKKKHVVCSKCKRTSPLPKGFDNVQKYIDQTKKSITRVLMKKNVPNDVIDNIVDMIPWESRTFQCKNKECLLGTVTFDGENIKNSSD